MADPLGTYVPKGGDKDKLAATESLWCPRTSDLKAFIGIREDNLLARGFMKASLNGMVFLSTLPPQLLYLGLNSSFITSVLGIPLSSPKIL